MNKFIAALSLLFMCVWSVYAFLYLAQRSAEALYDVDEVRYFINTDFYDFLTKRDWTNSLWQELDAYDQPPISKFVFGFILSQNFKDVGEKRDFILRYNDRLDLEHINSKSIKGSYLEPYIRTMRQASFWTTVISLILVFVMLWSIAKNLFICALAITLLVRNDIFAESMLLAKSDAQYIVFLLAALFLLFYSLEKRSVIVVVGAGMLAGLSSAVKLTGALFFLVLPFVIGLDAFILQKSSQFHFKTLVLCILCGFTIWYAVNPTLYPRPIQNTLRYAAFRRGFIDFQKRQTTNARAIFHSPMQKARASYCVFVSGDFARCPNGTFTPIPMVNALFIIGGIIMLIFQIFHRKSRRALWMLTISICIATAIFLSIPFHWARYYLPLVIILVMISCCGMLLYWRIVKVIWYYFVRTSWRDRN